MNQGNPYTIQDTHQKSVKKILARAMFGNPPGVEDKNDQPEQRLEAARQANKEAMAIATPTRDRERISFQFIGGFSLELCSKLRHDLPVVRSFSGNGFVALD